MHVEVKVATEQVGPIQKAMDDMGCFGLSDVTCHSGGKSTIRRDLDLDKIGPVLREALEKRLGASFKLPKMFLGK